MIKVESKKKSEAKLKEKYPKAIIADVTSKATNALIKLSPFYPHGDIPIPFSNGLTAQSVEGIWQGLKVFEKAGIEYASFENTKMKDIKRTVRKFGKPRGHRKGVQGTELLNYLEARFQIYLPSYKWVLENKVTEIIQKLTVASESNDIILLDYETNCDVFNLKKPLSHAYLIKAFIEGKYPDISLLETTNKLIKEKSKKKEKKVHTKNKKTNQQSLF